MIEEDQASPRTSSPRGIVLSDDLGFKRRAIQRATVGKIFASLSNNMPRLDTRSTANAAGGADPRACDEPQAIQRWFPPNTFLGQAGHDNLCRPVQSRAAPSRSDQSRSRDGFLPHTSLPESEVDVQSVGRGRGSRQEDFVRDIGKVHDMCEGWPKEVRRGVMDLEYGDEQRWKRLDPTLVELGEKAELERFKKTGVYEYVRRDVARRGTAFKSVKAKLMRVSRAVKNTLTCVVVLLRKSLDLSIAWMSCSPELRV